jgi:hypothetical protein
MTDKQLNVMLSHILNDLVIAKTSVEDACIEAGVNDENQRKILSPINLVCIRLGEWVEVLES